MTPTSTPASCQRAVLMAMLAVSNASASLAVRYAHGA